MLTATYAPGDSPLHRLPAGAKLAGFSLALLVLGLVRRPEVLVAGVLLALAALLVARLPRRVLADLLRPALGLAVVLGIFQVLLADLVTAVSTVTALVTAIVLSGVLTATTPMESLLDAGVRALGPLRRVGVDPERVALTLSLALTSIPVLMRILEEVGQARKARGAERSWRALAVPVVIRTVRHADRLGDALAARGVDD